MLSVAIAHAQPAVPDNQTKIIDAIGKTDHPALFRLLDSPAALNAQFATGDTPLAVAAALGRMETIELLLDRGADVNVSNSRGWTPLMVAIFYGNSDVAKLLISRGAKTDVVGDDGASAHSLATWRGDATLTALLPLPPVRPMAANDLVGAVTQGDLQAVDRLIAAGVRPNAADEQGNPATVLAAALGELTILERLVKAGAPVDLGNANGVTALMIAVQQGRIDVVKGLLDLGADPARKAGTTSAIAMANAMGSAEIAKLLRSKAGSSFLDEDGLSVLAAAAAANDRATVEKMLVSGLDPNGGVVNGRKVIPLSIAAYRGSSLVVALLLDRGAVPNVADGDGTTPLMAAVAGNHIDIASSLMARGANPKITNKAGLSANDMARSAGWRSLGNAPLYSLAEFNDAIRSGDVGTVRSLLAIGTQTAKWPTQADDRGWYPLMYEVVPGIRTGG